MPVHVITEANRCLQCKNPRCRMLGCPIQTNIPEVIRLFKENRMMEAAEILFENNPLSVVCSLVCNHEDQCEGHCVRGIKGEPVHFSSIENYISDSCFERLDLSCAPYNGMKVGVIGAGPAGITIAIILARRGYKVTVFETREKIGYRRMRDMGIMFRPNFELGGSTSIQDLFDDGYRSVFVGTGAWKPRKLGVPGETFGHVFYAINYLNNPDVYELGNKVAIIGAGNAAMDVARTAIRHGAHDVTVYVRKDKVAASENEYNYAVLDGVHFEFRKNIVRIVDEGAIFCDVVEDPETGKWVDDHSTDHLVEADSVMISISQVPRDRLVNRDHELHLNQRGTLQIDDQGETTMEGVFASGDVVTGAKTVVAAVAAAKQIAENMDLYMQEKYGEK